MKVLQLISPTGFYGAERWIIALAKNAANAGFLCDLGVTVESPYRTPEIVSRYPADAGAVHQLPMSNRFDTRVVLKTVEVVKSRGIDIVHTHGYKSDTVGLLAARIASVPVVSTAHGFTRVTSIKDRTYHLVGNACLRRMDRVVPLSVQLAKEVGERGVRPERITIIGNGVDVGEVDAVRRRPRSGRSKPRRLGYVGQLVERKRVNLLLEAFDMLWRDDNALTLDIWGDGDKRPKLEAFASALRSGAAIRFHGFAVNRLERMADLDLIALASAAEGVPRVLMEAMLLEIPCVAFGIPGVDELIVHEASGLLAADGEVDDLYRCCRRVLSDDELASSLAKGGRDRVLARFSAERMARRYAELFSEVKNGRDGGHAPAMS